MTFLVSCLLGLGLLGGLLVALTTASEEYPMGADWYQVLGALLFRGLFFVAGCWVSLVVVSLICHWPLQ